MLTRARAVWSRAVWSRAVWSPATWAGGWRDGDECAALAELGRDAVRAGLVVGSGGNLSARRPGADECWVTTAGARLDRLGPAEFVRLRISDGATIGPARGRVPSSEVALHLAAYRSRVDVNAVAHLHPQSVILLDALGERVRLVSTDHAFYLRTVARVRFGQPGTDPLARAVAAALAPGTDCAVLAHHGCVVVGDTVDLAHRRALYLEEAARMTYRTLALGRVDLPECPPDFLANLDHPGTANI